MVQSYNYVIQINTLQNQYQTKNQSQLILKSEMLCLEINHNIFLSHSSIGRWRQLTGSFSTSVSLIVTDNLAFAGLRSRFVDFGSARLDFFLQTSHKSNILFTAPRIKIDSKFSYFGGNLLKYVLRFGLILHVFIMH